MTLILSRKDVEKVLKMNDCINVVENAFLELANGTAVLPLRINITPHEGLALYMPAYLKEMGALACKVVTVYKNNPSKYQIPTTIGKVLLQDPNTGDVICIMDGGYLTAVRTGAASGVATKYLAQEKDNMSCGIFGAGVQAKMQLWAISEVRNINQVYVYDQSREAAESFANEMFNKLGIKINVAESADDLLKCEIICTATSSPTPIFDGASVLPGTHINGIGSHTPNARELDSNIIIKSKFIGDSKEACLKEAGDIIIPISNGEITEDHFYGELGEIINGSKQGRIKNEEITIFKSNGLAIQDVATAKLVYDKAISLGIGIEVQI